MSEPMGFMMAVPHNHNPNHVKQPKEYYSVMYNIPLGQFYLEYLDESSRIIPSGLFLVQLGITTNYVAAASTVEALNNTCVELYKKQYPVEGMLPQTVLGESKENCNKSLIVKVSTPEELQKILKGMEVGTIIDFELDIDEDEVIDE